MKIKATPIKLIILLCILCTNVFAQDAAKLSGKLVSVKANVPVGYATALLIKVADSTKKTAALTSADGNFDFTAVTPGDYWLRFSALGYKSTQMKISFSNASKDLGIVKIEEDAINLKEVAVVGQQASVKMKKDTVEFNATAFKTKPNAAVEDLLKKLPGVEIDRDGNILVQGQKVSRLTVDGKDFFGTDPQTATKNLPADAIAKVQIIDSKTLEAKATGVDDGQREKVLNLTIKEDKKKGWFGNANLYGGTTDRYNSYLSANHFNKNLQFAVLGMSNNVNNSNFGFSDLNSFSGGNIGNIFAPPGGGSFSININNGRTTIGGSGVFDNSAIGEVNTHSGGLNYSNTWGKKKSFSLSSSYFTYFSNGIGTRFSNIEDLNRGDVLRTAEVSNRISDNQAHRFNLRAEYHPDSLTDIIFRPNVILNYSSNTNIRNFNSAFDNNGANNDGDQNLTQKNVTPSLFGEFSVLRRLPRKKGSVSLRLNGTSNTFNSDWVNRSLINNYTSGNAVVENIDQQTAQENSSKTYTINANYVRPIAKKWNGSLGYFYRKANLDASQLTLNYNPTTDSYDQTAADFSNSLDSYNWYQAVNLGVTHNLTNWTYVFGLNLQETGLQAKLLDVQNNNNGEVSKQYYNVVPRVNINFKSKTNQTLSFNYTVNLNLPAVNDLQPVQNNSNPLYRRIGNPDLELSKAHRFVVNFNTFSPDNNKYWNGYFVYNLTFDGTGNDVNYVNGMQLVRPVNVDGNYFINAGSNFGMPSKLKGLRVGYGVNLNTSKNVSFISGAKNNTYRYNISPNASWNYDIQDKLNASLFISVGYNKVNNSLPLAVDNKYFNFNNTASLSYELIKNFRIDAQLDHIGTAGRTGGFNNNAFLLNAGIERYFMERRFTLAIKGFDILKQNVNIERSVNSSRIEDIRYNNITRYFYLSLNFKIAKAGASSGRTNPRSTVN